MSKIAEVLKNHKKMFVPFITAGDPDLETTKKLILAMEEAGATIIELGIPFSDPMAEGPVIQEADIRALNAGTTTDKVFDMIKEEGKSRPQEEVLEKERKLQEAELAIKKKFGKNAILKGVNFKAEATTRERNMQIGGHKSGEKGGGSHGQK